MTCGNLLCGNTWELQLAHIIKMDPVPEGCRELVKCPKCGFEQTVTRPDMNGCGDD